MTLYINRDHYSDLEALAEACLPQAPKAVVADYDPTLLPPPISPPAATTSSPRMGMRR